MSYFDNAKELHEIENGKLVSIYGKSYTGKTTLGATFPKPMLYVKIGDQGVNTIKNQGSDIKVIDGITSASSLNDFLIEARGKEYSKIQSIFCDTFGMIQKDWRYDNVTKRAAKAKDKTNLANKRMTQQDWGDMMGETEELLRNASRLSTKKWVILTFHEIMDRIEGMEDEFLPDVRVDISKGVRNYVEALSNYGIHTCKLVKTLDNGKEVLKYAADIGANPYYWTKVQVDSTIKLPKRMINPTFDKLMEIVNGGTK